MREYPVTPTLSLGRDQSQVLDVMGEVLSQSPSNGVMNHIIECVVLRCIVCTARRRQRNAT